jgi:lipopolysaccharide transport system ATP-binding protein
MFVRLAFAVTTSLEADVLLIDEALAVGDVFFRQKCYQRLAALRERGVAIVLVSHALNEVEQFCQRALLLHGGHVTFEGPAIEAVKRYYLLGEPGRSAPTDVPMPAREGPQTGVPGDALSWPGPEAFLDLSHVAQVENGGARCTALGLCDADRRPRRVFAQGERASFFFEFELAADIEVPAAGVELVSDKGIIVHGKTTLEYGSDVPREVPRGSRLRFRQDVDLELAGGEYTFNVGLGVLRAHDYDRRARISHADLDARIARVCLLPAAGSFAVVLRCVGAPAQLLHHGVANLRGSCRVSVVAPPGRGAPSAEEAAASADQATALGAGRKAVSAP